MKHFRPMLYLFAIALFATAILLACARVEPVMESYVDIAKEKGISREYMAELGKWTRKAILYSEFDTRAHVIGTFANREFRAAYDAEYARLYALTQPEQVKKAKLAAEAASEFTEFFVYAYVPDRDAIDFSKPNSIWKIFLIDEKGARFDPVEIRQITRITPFVEQFYPYVNQYYGKFYTIKFPRIASEKPRVVFTGVLGRLELTY